MKTVKKYTRGKFKGYNIRQYKNGLFVVYLGIVSQSEAFAFFSDCENWLKNHLG